MSVRDIRAGGAFVELSIRDKLTQGINSAAGKLRAFASGVGMISTALTGIGGTLSMGGILGMGKIFADTGSEIHDMAIRTGVAADNLSELKFAADQTGTAFGVVEKAMRFMVKRGLDVHKFDEILVAVSQIADDSERAAAAMKIFGDKGVGTALLPMAGELGQLRAEARGLGLSMSPRQAALADDLGDSFVRLKGAFSGLSLIIGEAMAPSLIATTTALVGVTQSLQEFTKELIRSTNSMSVGIGEWMQSLMPNGASGIRGLAFGELAKWLQGKPSLITKPKRTIPDFSDLSQFVDTKGGGSTRGTFRGFRAENLSVGTGGGIEKKLEGIKAILEKIHIDAKGTKDAVEDLEPLAFE